MHRITIRPLSLNSAYRGRRFATEELSSYKQAIGLLAPKLPQIQASTARLEVEYEFGVSSKRCDADNLVKCVNDALAEKYGYNDNQIYKFIVSKVDVPKGKEYIAFNIKKL
jgi:Holliday junction resolvase RusA-like endonuclease